MSSLAVEVCGVCQTEMKLGLDGRMRCSNHKDRVQIKECKSNRNGYCTVYFTSCIFIPHVWQHCVEARNK